MTNQELMDLRQSNEAPFNHQEYTIWLHDQIVERIKMEIESIPVCNSKQVLHLPSLNKAE